MTTRGLTAEQIAAVIRDVNRYTGIFDGQILISQANQIRSELGKNGFEAIKINNSFGKRVAYQGLNIVFQYSDGRVFELQFRTPISSMIKNEIYPFYEEFRTSTNKSGKNALTGKMIERWARFILPKERETIVDFHRC